MWPDSVLEAEQPRPSTLITDRAYQRQRTAVDSQRALDALPEGREKRMIMAVDELLSRNLGTADGYLGSIGITTTRALQNALTAYGITPDYGAAVRNGLRHL